MQKIILNLLIWAFAVLNLSAQNTPPNLIISEIFMGSDPRSAYAEISNIGTDTTDLSRVFIGQVTNAGADFHRPTQGNSMWRLDDPRFERRMPGNQLPPGQTALIINNLVTVESGGDTVQLVRPFYWEQADIITLPVMELNGPSPLRFFGGDDALFLVWDKNGNGAFDYEAGVDSILDLFGNSKDYGGVREVYEIAGVSEASLNSVLIRKSSIETGNGGNFTATRGTSREDSEWLVIPWRPESNSFPATTGSHLGYSELSGQTPDTLKYGDVVMRSLRPWEQDGRNLLETARNFKVDKIMWISQNPAPYNQKVREEGIRIGTSMTDNASDIWYTSLSEEDRLAFVERYTTVNLDGEQTQPGHKQLFADGPVRHFTPDQTNPEWLDFYTNYVEYLYHVGIDALHRDDPSINMQAPRFGGTFTESSVEYFRVYLEENFSPVELAGMGVSDVSTFNVRDHFKSLGAPSNETLWEWVGSPLMTHYRRAMEQSDTDFYRDLKSALERRTGIHIPWSSNAVGPVMPYEEHFDFRIGEFQLHFNQPQTIMILGSYPRRAGMMQAFVSYVDGSWTTRPGDFLVNNRKHISTVYASGMIPMVPWCMYMHQEPRYYGTVEDFGDLFHFVSDHRQLFDDHELVSASGLDQQANLYSWLPNRELFYEEGDTSARVWLNRHNIFAYVRSKPGSVGAVIHLVDWNDLPGQFGLSFCPMHVAGVGQAKLTLLRPGLDPLVIDNYAGGTIELPGITPWGIIQVEPSEGTGNIPAPRLISHTRSVIASGSVVSFAGVLDDHILMARFVPDPPPGNVEFQELVSGELNGIDQNGFLEAYVKHSLTNDESAITRLRLDVYDDHRVDSTLDLSSLHREDVLEQFQIHFANPGEMKANGSFLADRMYMMGEQVNRGVSTRGEAAITLNLEPSWRYFTVRVGLDDAEDRRPCARFQVLFDGMLAYETPIINPTKSLLEEDERRVFDIALRIPEGKARLQLRVVNGGFFREHNTVIWAYPTVYTDWGVDARPPEVTQTVWVYPGAVTDYLNVKSEGSEIKNLTIYDIQGRVRWKEKMNAYYGTVNMSLLEQGIYFVKVETGAGIEVKRVVKLAD